MDDPARKTNPADPPCPRRRTACGLILLTHGRSRPRNEQGSGMLSWLRRRREQAERIEAEADSLITALGGGAYAEARRRAREASSDEMEREWSRIALAIARKTGRRAYGDGRRLPDSRGRTARQSEPSKRLTRSTSSCGSFPTPRPGLPTGFSLSAVTPSAGRF